MDQFGRPYRFNLSGLPAQFVNSRGGTAVGGVSLDKTAQVLVNLNNITGATLDPNTGQLILIGKKDTRLPPMNLDDLVVAIRSVYAGKDPGVTMVPVDPSWKDSTQRVEYFGATEGTRFGLTMFEADRYLKGLGAGKDSFTGEPVTPNVPGFKPEIDLACEYQTDVPWHRNWFVPNEVVLKQSADGKSMVFERATMRLESRFVQIRPDGTMVDVPGTSPVTDRFTRFVTEHYDEFAREKAELAELTRLAKIVGLVRWLRDNNIPVDLSWVNDYQVTKVETPKTTPGVSAEKVCFGGTFTTTSQGGVDYSTPNTYNQEDSQVHALRERAVASRPATVPLTWDLQQDGTTYTAVALNLAPGKTVGGYVTNQTDIALPTQGGLGVQFTRFYNSLDIRDSALGYGWSFIPYGLDVQKVLRPSGNKQFLVETQVRLFDAARSSVEMFEGPYKESQTGRVFYQPKCTACGYVDLTVQPDGGYILRRQDRILVSFNSQGQLSGFADENGNRVDYRYSGERLSEIGAPGGATLKLTYDSKGRLVQVTASDGRAAKYTFDSAGHLTSVTDATGYRTTYAYDSEHRLTAITDAAGRTLVEHKYDGLGRLVEQKGAQGYAVSAAYDPANRQATYTDTRGYRAVRTYDEQQRLVKETDPLGQSITYGYDKDGNLARFTDKRGNTTGYTYDQMGNLTQVTTPLKTAVQFGYDANRNLRYSIDPQMQLVLYEYDSRNNLTRVTDGLKVVRLNPDGSFSYDSSRAFSTQFEYDSYGNVKAVVGANGRRTEFGYDARGNLTSIKSAGRETRQEFDARARLTRVIDPLGRSAQFTYDDRDLMTGVTTAAGTTRYEYDAVGNLVKVTDANGNATRYVYDASGNLVQVIEATSAVTRYEYDVVGNLVAVIDANQRRTNFEYDALGRVVRETFTISGTSR
jgi:YD repeat-containing protein